MIEKGRPSACAEAFVGRVGSYLVELSLRRIARYCAEFTASSSSSLSCRLHSLGRFIGSISNYRYTLQDAGVLFERCQTADRESIRAIPHADKPSHAPITPVSAAAGSPSDTWGRLKHARPAPLLADLLE